MSKNTLHQLVRSLNKSEKGYFRKQASLHSVAGENNYVKLFDAIAAQPVYNEALLLEEFKGEPITNQFTAARHYLYRMVLKSLRSFHSKHSISLQLNETLMNVEVLFKRRAFDLCEREIKRAKKIIAENEMWDKFHEVTRWEKYMIGQRAASRKKEKAIDEIYEQDIQTAESLANLAEYARLSHKIFSIALRAGHIRSKKHVDDITQLMQHPLLQDEKEAMTVKARIFYNSIHAKYNETIGNDEAFNDYNQRFVDIMEQNEGHLKNEIINYVSAVYNTLLSLNKLNRREDFMNNLAKLRSIPERYPKQCTHGIRQTITLFSHNAELDYLVRIREFEATRPVVIRLEKILSEDAGTQYELIYLELHYYMAYSWFALGNYRKSLIWVNKILNSDRSLKLREDLSSYSRILAMAIHYELGNDRLVDYYVRSTYRYFRKQKKIPKWEKAVLAFLQLQLKPSSDSLDEQLASMRVKLKRLAHQPLEQRAFDHFDFIAWIDSKLHNKPFLQVTQRHFKQLEKAKK